MPIAMVLDLARDAVMLSLMMAGPLLGVALLVGLVISLLQAVTSIQEQTLTFVPKLFAVGATFLMLLAWMIQSIMHYTTDLFRSLPSLVG